MSLSRIKGQSLAVNFLKRSIESGRLAHAYLFYGPQEAGKDIAALEFAKALNCQSGAADACDECLSCIKMEKGTHPDLHWIEADKRGFIKIEHIRQMQKEIMLRPYEAKRKVFLINQAEAMTEEAANCLLKVLEEPPSHNQIILITSHKERLLATVISRCQEVRFFHLEKLSLVRLSKDFTADGLVRKNAIIDSYLKDNLSFKDRENLEFTQKVLLGWFRDLLAFKLGMPKDELINSDRHRDIKRLSARYEIEKIISKLKTLIEAEAYLAQNVNARLLTCWLRQQVRL